MSNWDGPDRRKDNNVALSLGKIDATLNMMNEEFDAKMGSISDRLNDYMDNNNRTIKIIESNNKQKLEAMNLAWNNRSDAYLKENRKEHEDLGSIISTLTVGLNDVSSAINDIKDDIHKIEEDMEDIEEAPMKQKAELVDKTKSIFFKVFMSGIATAAFGFIMYLITQYVRTK